MNKLCISLGLTLLLAGNCLSQVVYNQLFESGVEPFGWTTWDNGAFPDSWDHTPAIDGSLSALFTALDPLADKGAWYNFVAPLNEVQIDYLFRVSAFANPFYEELVSIWDQGLFTQLFGVYFQVEDLWVYTDAGYDIGPIPINTTLHLRLTYKNGAPSQVTMSLSLYPNEPVQIFSDVTGGTTQPDNLLFGPVGYDLYVVDDLVLTSPIPTNAPPPPPPPPPPPTHGHHGHHGGS